MKGRAAVILSGISLVLLTGLLVTTLHDIRARDRAQDRGVKQVVDALERQHDRMIDLLAKCFRYPKRCHPERLRGGDAPPQSQQPGEGR